ncbi:PAB-dependent poly(A)-specific ribonuclease subunit 3 [Oleoguttula sp. CCFEE 5521]
MPPEVIATRTEYLLRDRQPARTALCVGSSRKKSFNVESPSFTPKGPAPVQSPKIAGLSPRAAHAATFTPRGSGSVTPASSSHSKTLSNEFVPQSLLQSTQFAEFVPQNFVANAQSNLNHQTDGPTNLNPYSDPFLTNLDGTSGSITNPYAEHQPASNGQAYFQEPSTFRHPLNYHLYAALGPHRDQLAPYQRQTTDFFIPDDLREDLQRKAEATLQTFPSSTVPQNVDNHFHSLVMLDSVAQRTSTTFGYPSWIYKATSSTDGNTYALRRIEGFRLTNEQAIGLKLQWKKVTCSSAVRVHDAFTTQAFGDRSLIIVMDYFPLSQTLADKHFPRNAGAGRAIQFVPEHELWSYLVQLGNALRAIHQNDLAARSVVPSKVLLTSKNRLRLSGCCVLDILHYEQHRSMSELQQADLQDLGRLVLDIAARNPTAHTNPVKALDQISRNYTDRFRACLAWLLAPPNGGHGHASGDSSPDSSQYNVNMFLGNISDHVMNVFDSTLSRDDELTSTLTKETENGRLVRLLAKLNAILERPETNPATSQSPNQPSNAWSETGDRYYLTLFRDYVFHQVDHDGRPVLNLGHIVTCLNKLDAGIDERMQLVSRNEQSVFIVSYKELKRGFEAAWGELSRGSHGGRR